MTTCHRREIASSCDACFGEFFGHKCRRLLAGGEGKVSKRGTRSIRSTTIDEKVEDTISISLRLYPRGLELFVIRIAEQLDAVHAMLREGGVTLEHAQTP